jgi:hypothetical protein
MEKNKLSFTQFSKEILESGDIDPDYIFMRNYTHKNKLGKEFLIKWVRLKTVIYKSSSELEVLLCKVPMSKVSFGNERNKSKNKVGEFFYAIDHYFVHYGEYKLVESLAKSERALDALKTVPGIGPWAAWKLMDLIDCVLGYDTNLGKVDFRKAYEFPLKGLLMINGKEEDTSLLSSDELYHQCLKNAWKQMPKVKTTPHNKNRGLRINELETCLCKYHSYIHGHYYPGKDLEHLKKSIAESKYESINKFKWYI